MSLSHFAWVDFVMWAHVPPTFFFFLIYTWGVFLHFLGVLCKSITSFLQVGEGVFINEWTCPKFLFLGKSKEICIIIIIIYEYGGFLLTM